MAFHVNHSEPAGGSGELVRWLIELGAAKIELRWATRGYSAMTNWTKLASCAALGMGLLAPSDSELWAADKVDFNKQSHTDISGIIYAPNSEVKFRKSDMEIESGDDDDWDTEDDEPMEDDFGDVEANSIGAAIVAGKLTIDKKTSLSILGKDIAAFRPLLGVVE